MRRLRATTSFCSLFVVLIWLILLAGVSVGCAATPAGQQQQTATAGSWLRRLAGRGSSSVTQAAGPEPAAATLQLQLLVASPPACEEWCHPGGCVVVGGVARCTQCSGNLLINATGVCGECVGS